jgi:protoheme IX farnesyltransferase
MLPVVAGAKETRRQIVIYTLLLVPLSLMPWFLGFSGPVYAVAACVLGLGFLVSVWRVATDKQDNTGVSLTNDAPARAAFKFSILYLFILLAALAIDHCLGRVV